MAPPEYLSAPTVPEFMVAYANIEGGNNRFHYVRPEQKVYSGRSIVESIVNDIKYSGKTAKNYDLIKDLMQDTKDQPGIEIAPRSGLYENPNIATVIPTSPTAIICNSCVPSGISDRVILNSRNSKFSCCAEYRSCSSVCQSPL